MSIRFEHLVLLLARRRVSPGPNLPRRADPRIPWGSVQRPIPSLPARGEKLYTPNCAFCHGARANGGDTGPDLIRSTLVLHDEKGELIGPVVHKGRPDRGMPAFANFSDSELADLAAFLHMKIELAANRGLYKELNIVTGERTGGRGLFSGALRQLSLRHGRSGSHRCEVRAARSAGEVPVPGASARSMGSQAARAPKVTVTLPSGETVTGRLKRLDDFDVSLVRCDGDYHSWPRSGVKVEVEDRLPPTANCSTQYTDADMHNLLAYLVTLK